MNYRFIKYLNKWQINDSLFYSCLFLLFTSLLQSCGSPKKEVPVKNEDSFDTAHVAIKYIAADHQDSIRKAYKVEYRWLIYEKNEDSTVEYYNSDGKIIGLHNYSNAGKLKTETSYTYNTYGSLIEIKEKQEGVLLYKRIYVRKDTLKVAEYYLNIQSHDTVLKLRFTHNEKQQLIEARDISTKDILLTKYEYWPNGLLHKEIYYAHDSLAGMVIYKYNHSGHLRVTAGNNAGSYLYEKRLYDEKGRLRERNADVSVLGVHVAQSFIFNYNEKHLLRRIGMIKDTEISKPVGQDVNSGAPDGHQSEITYIHYKFKAEK